MSLHFHELTVREVRPDTVSFRFRHSLVRDASYAMLTESDRVLAHRLAAQWLARQTRTTIPKGRP